MFLYFIPNHPGGNVTRADFEALGLGYALSVGDPDARVCRAGPEGLSGILAVPSPVPGSGVDRGPDSLYEPAKQVWRKGPGGKYWVGFYKNQPPMPASLRREKLIEGEPTKLSGGGEWLVPIARSVVRGTTLPKAMVLGEDNETWEQKELEEYAHLCRDAERAWEVLSRTTTDEDGNGVAKIGWQEGMRIAVSALSANYRVGPIEVAMLRLTDGDMWEVLRSVCDVPALERVMAERAKKNSAPGT
jgi:hypothetical protein